MKPKIGREGGQRYPIVKSIKTFLGQMAEGGAQPAASVLKELLQNADDAKATEVSIVLDERIAPKSFSNQYQPLCLPAIIVRNNAPFRIKEEVSEGEEDDFTAIRDVASGHKRTEAVAAGRFGIGFNSVYFLTDTPLIFSRREVNVFDLLHNVLEDDGWIFDLNDFPANADSSAGEVKAVLEWCFPKVSLDTSAFGNLATEGDYLQAVFRLPFRRKRESGEYLFDGFYTHAEERKRFLEEMSDEAKRSILFLKSVESITFSILDAEGSKSVFSKTQITRNPPEFDRVLEAVKEKRNLDSPISYERTITYYNSDRKAASFSFHIWHAVYSDNAKLKELRRFLEASDRAVPWVSVAVPLDTESTRMDGSRKAKWRVFLPLLESGPSSCIFSGAFFVGPSRQKMEYRLDEGVQRTEWNKALIEYGLVKLFSDITLELPSTANDLLDKDPKAYLSLFPEKFTGSDPHNLTDYFNSCFSRRDWVLSLRDIWNEGFDLLVGDNNPISLNLVPEWLMPYRDYFRGANAGTKFITTSLGNALRDRLADTSRINREITPEVAEIVLKAAKPPKTDDLKKLLDVVLKDDNALQALDGAWAFVRSDDKNFCRFDAEEFYIIDSPKNREPILDHLKKLPLSFKSVQLVEEEGLAKNFRKENSKLTNITGPDSEAAVELMCRLPYENQHDVLAESSQVAPIVDFLLQQDPRWLTELKLGFMVRTARNKESRRDLGVIFLKPSQLTNDDEALWEVWFRTLFAEVDPAFAKEIKRLLDKQPHCLHMLSSQDCEVVEVGLGVALGVLSNSLEKKPNFIVGLEKEINDRKNVSAGFSERVSRSIIEYADKHWEEMNDTLKFALKKLPIHRTADERYVSLTTDHDSEPDEYTNKFMLQTEDDLKDAPVGFASYTLLQCRDRSTKNFYRLRLHIEVHGRIAVLRDILREIGATDDRERNEKFLRYLLAYYASTIDELRGSHDQSDKADVAYFNEQLSRALFVPCIDGLWHNAKQCCRVTRVQELLVDQKWSPKEIPGLLQQLFQDEHMVCSDDSDEIVAFLKKQGTALNEIDPRSLYQRAIISDSAALSLKQRAKLIIDNLPEVSDVSIQPSSAVQGMTVPTLSGAKPLEETAYLESYPLTPLPMRFIAPSVVDKKAFAQQMALTDQQATKVLRALRIADLPKEEINQQVVNRLPELWTQCVKKDDRFSILNYIGISGLAEQLKSIAANLNVVLVRTKNESWVWPDAVFSPAVMKTDPPFLSDNEKPSVSVPSKTEEVWNTWCAIGNTVQALREVCEKAKSQKAMQQCTKDLYDWIGRAYSFAANDFNQLEEALRTTAWVWARKDGKEEFHVPEDVIVHKGNDILQSHFWVPAARLPAIVEGREKEIGFSTELEPTRETLEDVCKCLSLTVRSDRSALSDIYKYIADSIADNPILNNVWEKLARDNRVFSTLRDEPRNVSSLELYIGKPEDEDLSLNFVCLCYNESVSNKMVRLYETLGVPKQPTLKQILNALCHFDEKDSAKAYRSLVDILVRFTSEDTVNFTWENIKVKTCDGGVRPLGECYWDTILGHKNRIQPNIAHYLIDTQSSEVKRILEWIHACDEKYPKCLRKDYGFFLNSDIETVASEYALDYILEPWRQLCKEATRIDSNVNDEIRKKDLIPPPSVSFHTVDKIALNSKINDLTVVDQAPTWAGPIAFGDVDKGLFLSALHIQKDTALDAQNIEKIDRVIAQEVLHILGDTSYFRPDDKNVEWLLNTLERPSTVIQNLGARNRSQFIYQYQDQVADPEFTIIYDEYQKTKSGSIRHKELEERLYDILSKRFVNARRDQIRGYGYDACSVIAELIQNAEDAYIQGAWLEMNTPEPCKVVFRYEKHNTDGITMNIEHKGRPFNYFRHGAKEDRAFMRDVEGVLRSAGSYKPHAQMDGSGEHAGTENIGRFGLGFKSVFLLTECPEIHSGHWHFAIQNGCIPVERPVPENWNPSLTRFTLPLVADTGGGEPDENRLAQLLPFLRKITFLSISDENSRENVITIKNTIISKEDGLMVEECLVVIDEQPAYRLIRVRNNSAQIAMLIDSAGLPIHWKEFFENDLYAFLPLKSRLGCGIGVSHHFQVQSGRTHLTGSEDNVQCARELAALLSRLIKALKGIGITDEYNQSISTYFKRFWQIWDWNEHDAECKFITDEIALELWNNAYNQGIVPTYNPNRTISLNDGPCFYFMDIPVKFREALLENQFAILTAENKSIELLDINMVPEGFVTNLKRLAEYTSHHIEDYLSRISWEQIAQTCVARPWFAEKPELLNVLASSLSGERRDEAAEWLKKCVVAGSDYAGVVVNRLPCDLFHQDIADSDLLPKEFMNIIDPGYTETALNLLEKAGLKISPSMQDMRFWITGQMLNTIQCIDLLQYLTEGDRFKRYWDLQYMLQQEWIPNDGLRITPCDAQKIGLLPEEVTENKVFAVWLGIELENPPFAPPEPEKLDTVTIIKELANWWGRYGAEQRKQYSERVYPFGEPVIRECSGEKLTISERREWMILFILGSLHTMGRQLPEQHRGFLRNCFTKGWLDIISDRNRVADKWFEFVDDFIEDPIGNQNYYHWVKNLISFYQFNKWLPEYVSIFMDIDRNKRKLTFDEIVEPRKNPNFSGGGPDAPSLRRPLGRLGLHFILRELVRLGIIKGANIYHLCYVPSEKVKNLLQVITNGDQFEFSEDIYDFLANHLGEDNATFDKAFDLPLIVLANDYELQMEIMGTTL